MSKNIERVFIKYKNEEYRTILRDGFTKEWVQQMIDDEKGWELNPGTNILYKIIAVTERFQVRLNIWREEKKVQILPMYQSDEYKALIKSFNHLPEKVQNEIRKHRIHKQRALKAEAKIREYIKTIGFSDSEVGESLIMSMLDDIVLKEDVDTVYGRVENEMKEKLFIKKDQA